MNGILYLFTSEKDLLLIIFVIIVQSLNKGEGEQISDGQFGELMTMIRNAEKSTFSYLISCVFPDLLGLY